VKNIIKLFFIILFLAVNFANAKNTDDELLFLKIDSQNLFKIETEEIWNNPEYNIKKWNSALAEAIRKQDILLQAEAYTNLGLAYSYISMYDKSFENYKRALELYTKQNNLLGIAEINNNIGMIYKFIKNYDKSIEHYNNALQIFLNLKNDTGITQALTYIGNIYYHKNNYAEAIKYFENALSLQPKLGNIKIFTFPLNNLGTIYIKQEIPQKALDYFLRAYNLSVFINSKWDIANSLNNLGEAYTALKEYDKALKCLNESLKISTALNAKDIQMDSYKFLKDLYLKKGDKLNYLENHKAFADLQLEIFDLEKARRIYEQQIQFDTEKLELEKKYLELKNFYQNWIIAVLIIAVFLFLFFIIKIKKSYKEINRQKSKLEEAIKEKNEFIGIASHDLKNPLSLIIGGNDLIAVSTDDEKILQYSSMINNGANRMQHIITNILDANMIENAGISPKKQEVDLNKLLTELIENYKIPAEKKCIKIESDIQINKDIVIETDAALLKQVLDNLLSNAIKYSFKGTKVIVAFTETNGILRISIKDSGPGLSAEDLNKMFKKFTRLTPKPTGDEESVGLGLYIVKKLCNILNYNIYCESMLGKGTTFHLEIKK